MPLDPTIVSEVSCSILRAVGEADGEACSVVNSGTSVKDD